MNPDNPHGRRGTIIPSEALIDPQNNSSFVYKCAGETFTLYSKGKNGTDNDGRKNADFSSDSALPTVAEDDILFWPPKNREPAEEIPDLNLSNADD